MGAQRRTFARNRNGQGTITVLWAEDDQLNNQPAVEALEYEGFRVLTATSGSMVLSLLQRYWRNMDLLILDIKMPPGERLRRSETFNGHRTGLVLGKIVKKLYPKLPILGLSFVRDPEVEEWFQLQGAPYLSKTASIPEILRAINSLVHPRPVWRPPKCFIVHGHDDDALDELNDYLEKTLNFPAPVVLKNESSIGRTIIEKFEEKSEGVDLVFVLLTPDDQVKATPEERQVTFRARQNVIFELGYFYGKLGRCRGRVIILHKTEAELPSDIHGIASIDISKGIAGADNEIRRELHAWLPKSSSVEPVRLRK